MTKGSHTAIAMTCIAIYTIRFVIPFKGKSNTSIKFNYFCRKNMYLYMYIIIYIYIYIYLSITKYRIDK